jgi:hypothetical protein
MSETITLQALDLSGETLTMFLRKSDGTLLNTGGDAMTESGSTGVFTATLAEARSGLGPLAVRICGGSETADNLLYDGFLAEGSSVIDSTSTVVLDSSVRVKLDATQPDYAPLKSSDYTAPANADITDIKAKTDNLPADPASNTAVGDAADAILADTDDIQSRLPAALINGFMSSVLGDTAHGGEAATLFLSTVEIHPSSTNAAGVTIRGDGSGAAVDIKGGEYADGIKTRSGDTSGYGICSNGVQGGARFWSTNGYGVYLHSDNSSAFRAYAGAFGFEVYSSNNCFDIYSQNGNAVYLQSQQNDAVVIYPGANDVGVHVWGGQSSGDAVALSSNGSGSVFYPVDLSGVTTQISGLNDISASDVKGQVVDALSDDTYAELTAPPAATSSLKDKITWLFMYARNKVTQTATQRKVYRDDTTTVAGTSTTSDNGTTFTKGEDA